jgi:hypothetical protein
MYCSQYSRLVGESNPSHPMDSGAATPVASRGIRGVAYGNRTRLDGATTHPRHQTSNVTMQRRAAARRWAVVDSHHVLPLFRRTLSLDQLTALMFYGKESLPSTRPKAEAMPPSLSPATGAAWQRLAPAEGVEPSKDRLTAGCLTIRLRWKDWWGTPSRLRPKSPPVSAKFSTNSALERADGSGCRIRTCVSGSRAQRPPTRRSRSIAT